ncbi:MAG: L-threonylcarbamoyladenylate synthase [Verrucomicrobiota bacterium]|nr:L-threonylcarbamoyladenylate synthase [Verrucomicrobiota bacterium]
MKTETIGAEAPNAIARAVECLRAGDPVALPTETVYGLAADALNVSAVLKIFEAKERPHFDPLIVHLPDHDWLDRLTTASHEPLVRRLIERFWPGPLTLVLPRREIVPDLVTAGLETVALRVSAHPQFREIIHAFGSPLAAPSANRFGRISPTNAQHVQSELDGRIPLIIDAGATTHGIESTIVALRDGEIEILRPGPVTAEELQAFGHVRRATVGERPRAPGQLPSHYAPRTPLVVTNDLCHHLGEGRRVAVLNFVSLSQRRDLREAAASLFRRLRELDDGSYDLIVAEEFPEEGLGLAIMDRLRRAAAR